MLILKGDLIKSICSPLEVIEAVEEAMVLYEGDDFYMPARMHAEHGDNVLLLMPSFVTSAFGTKLVTVFPENLSRDKAVIQGVMLLNDPVSGTPISLMDASVLTGLRTGAISAVGIRHLADPEVRSLGIIGAGTQAFYQAIMASQVRSFDRIYISDLERKRAKKLESELHSALDVEIRVSSSNEELVTDSDVIITATTSMNPVLPSDRELLSGKTVVGIGSFKPSMREIPEELFQLIDRVFVDSRQAVEESGDLIFAMEKGLIREGEVFTLGKLINRTIKPSRQGTSFFKSVGMALFDLLVAEKIYAAAKSQGAGIEIDIS
jgi:ornithine cyclodeaminase